MLIFGYRDNEVERVREVSVYISFSRYGWSEMRVKSQCTFGRT